jgi:hypothetical protein
MEFGSPIPPLNQKGRVHGEWHLWIYDCAWRLDEGNTVLVASEDERSKIERAIQCIEGRILTSVVVVPPALETSFDFENKIVLHLFPIYTENVEHWMLFTPEKKVLVIGPGTNWSYDESSSR